MNLIEFLCTLAAAALIFAGGILLGGYSVKKATEEGRGGLVTQPTGAVRWEWKSSK